MSYNTLLYDLQDNVATITLNRPQRLNSLSLELLTELRAAILQAPEDGARALLITGAGRGFSSGADLVEDQLPVDEQGRPDLGKALDERYHPMLEALNNLQIPVVHAINGVAAGAGASLAIAGDIVIAARSASFKQAFIHIGLIPDASGTWLMPRLVGRARALGMSMLGEAISAQQAADWGLIWTVVDDDELMTTATDMARHLASQPTQAMAAIRKVIRASYNNDLPAQLELEAELQRSMGQTEDFMEGVMAFVQKRDPVFKGK